jgi:transposase
LIAYEIYRGPKNQYGKISGVLGRSEFGLEVVITLAYLVFSAGLSFDKACFVLQFFQNLRLRKSQADALLKQLSRHWESEFEVLCTLLANSTVVHADETSWSINSVWAFLSEQARLLIFGVHKNADTLAAILNLESFGGTVISDDAAVYANFSNAQKCWAHLLRKAIKLTLMEPDNQVYRHFTDRLLEIYRKACQLQRDRRFGDQGRKAKVGELDDEILDLCAPMWVAELPPQEEAALDDYRKLANELMRLMLAQQLFTFVTGKTVKQPNGETSAMAGTNNEAERTLRGAANARKTGRTSKSTQGAKRRTITESVLESLRVHLPTFTLSSILAEIQRWSEHGRSCFMELLEQLKLPPPKVSILDALFPPPTPSKA